jgi:hypothetical protein
MMTIELARSQPAIDARPAIERASNVVLRFDNLLELIPDRRQDAGGRVDDLKHLLGFACRHREARTLLG